MQAGCSPWATSSVAAVALVHDAVAGKGRHDIEIEADAGLALGDLPGADLVALASAEAHAAVDDGDAVLKLFGRSPRAKLDAGRVDAVHAAARDGEVELLSVFDDRGLLDEQPVVRGQPFGLVPFVGPVRNRYAAGDHLGKGFFGSGYLAEFDSLHASTQAPHPTHLPMSIRVANWLSASDADARPATPEAARVQAAAMLPFQKGPS